jgi:chemotaxis signal transduction protein
MAIFLQVRTGSLYLMLDALQVHEVIGLEALVDGAQGHTQWRDQVLSAVDLGQFFGLPHAQPSMGVVYTPSLEGEPLLLKVEEVLGLHNQGAQHWSRLPNLPERAAQYFDTVWLEAEHSRQSFRLRYPLDLEAFKGVAPTGFDEEFGHDGMDRIDQ